MSEQEKFLELLPHKEELIEFMGIILDLKKRGISLFNIYLFLNTLLDRTSYPENYTIIAHLLTILEQSIGLAELEKDFGGF